jgi:hypothetical protein
MTLYIDGQRDAQIIVIKNKKTHIEEKNKKKNKDWLQEFVHLIGSFTYLFNYFLTLLSLYPNEFLKNSVDHTRTTVFLNNLLYCVRDFSSNGRFKFSGTKGI